MKGLFPVLYFGNINYYAQLIKFSEIIFEKNDFWEKQTYRNRCEIYGANGLLKLIVPIAHNKKSRQTSGQICIAGEINWQKIHWRSLEAAYRSSPYFEYYEDDIFPLFQKKFDSLLEYNLEIHNCLLKLLGARNIPYIFSKTYEKHPIIADYRMLSENIKIKEIKEYMQVFSSKHGYIPNLSILDLIFNEGPNSLSLLNHL